jgi:hypothetical protein
LLGELEHARLGRWAGVTGVYRDTRLPAPLHGTN